MTNKAAETRRIRRRAKQWREFQKSPSEMQAQLEAETPRILQDGDTVQSRIETNKAWAMQCLRSNLRNRHTAGGEKLRKYYRDTAAKWLCQLRNIRKLETILAAN